MRTRSLLTMAGMAAAGVGLLAAGIALADSRDFGLDTQKELAGRSEKLFGIERPMAASTIGQAVTLSQANADATKLATLAKGLQARVVTAGVAGANIDMMALWPNDAHPTHLIACNEQGTAQPGVQRISIASGAVETIVTGTTACDGIRRTPWGTILFSEEAGGGAQGGRAYELLNPLATTGVTLDRTTGLFSGGTGAANLATRTALGRDSFEGFAIYANGVTYFADENRPSTGKAGGPYFKFIPAAPRTAGAPPITSLANSPLSAGKIVGLRLGKRAGNTDYGQGTQTGLGSWIDVCAGPACTDIDLRARATALNLTGYYRPEDLDIDLAAEAAGEVRFCAANTGNEGDDRNWGEIICITDGTIAAALANSATPEVQYFVMGTEQFAMPDNVAYQPHTGNWVFQEDSDQAGGKNNDLWDCLPDGKDDDTLSDGCIRIASLDDLNAEWTGGIFDARGKRFFVSIQHNITGKGVVLEISGWKIGDGGDD